MEQLIHHGLLNNIYLDSRIVLQGVRLTSFLNILGVSKVFETLKYLNEAFFKIFLCL